MKLNLGLASLLTIIFTIAKILKLVTWSWWAVFAPVLISTAVVAFLLGVVLLITAVTVALDMKKDGLL